MLKRLTACLLALLLCVGAAGCASSAKNWSGETSPAEGGGTDTGFPSETVDEDAQAAVSDGEQARKLIKNVELTIQTKTYDTFLQDMQAALDRAGGYIQQADMSGGDRRSATVVIRVPADKLDSLLDALASHGTVTSRTENVQDVTMEYVDVESRLEVLRAEQTALLALLEKAESLEDVLTVREKLATVQEEIASYEAQLRTLQLLTANSTVTIRLHEVEKEPAAGESMWQEIGRRFTDSLAGVGRGLRAVFIWVAGSLPYLLVAAAVIAILWLLIRLCVRRRRRRPAAQAVGQGPVPADRMPLYPGQPMGPGRADPTKPEGFQPPGANPAGTGAVPPGNAPTGTTGIANKQDGEE